MIKKTIWRIAGIVAVVGAIYGLIVLSRQDGQGRSGQPYPILGQQHINVGASHPTYNSNPPTSGWHYAEPAEWGIYENELPDEKLVHNLEHGGIWISYKDVDEGVKTKLGDIGRRYPQSVIVTPREKNDEKIILASWGRLQKFSQYDEESIIKFIKANKNRSPEPFAL